MKDKISRQLKNCNCENRGQYTYPFYFEMKKQKVMLITYIPSFQAVYRQLASIRFFRQIFLALCGPNPDIKTGSFIENFLNAIYWTHYHKCYIRKEIGSFMPGSKDISSHCYDKYVAREIDALKPEIIVILGKQLIDQLFNESLEQGKLLNVEFRGIPAICAHFPKGFEPEFIQLRKKLKQFSPWIDTNPVPDYMHTSVADIKETLAVHAHFEIDGLQSFWRGASESEPVSTKNKNIDKLWIERELVPRHKNYTFIVSCFSFMEDQLKPLLAEKPDINIPSKTTIEETIGIILSEYQMSNQLTNIYMNDIRNLRVLRNQIVHSGGRITPDKNLRENIKNIPGVILEPSGMVIITEQYCEHAMGIVKEFVKLISQLPTDF